MHAAALLLTLSAGPYDVVCLVPEGDPYEAAADALIERHEARRLRATPGDLASLLPAWRERPPENVAVVVRPEDLDVNLAAELLAVSTRVDGDPFADFAWGVVTGRTAEAAVALVGASDPGRPRPEPAVRQFGVGGDQLPRSMTQAGFLAAGRGVVPLMSYLSKGDSDEASDRAFIKESLPALNDAPILLLASHGYPDGMVGGLKAADVARLDLGGSVVLNIACYTAVTGRWFEDDWRAGAVAARTCDPADSFALAVLDAAPAAYVAYAGPRPSGPALMAEAVRVAGSGRSMGELRREAANAVVMAHLLAGGDGVAADPQREGEQLDPARTAGDVVARMAVGGVLFGDPAFVPFPENSALEAVRLTLTPRGEELRAEVALETMMPHLFAGDELTYWGGRGPAVKLEAAVPLDGRPVADVRLSRKPVEGSPHVLAAAVEEHGGRRLLRVKAVQPQPAGMTAGFAGEFVVTFGEGGPAVVRHKAE